MSMLQSNTGQSPNTEKGRKHKILTSIITKIWKRKSRNIKAWRSSCFSLSFLFGNLGSFFWHPTLQPNTMYVDNSTITLNQTLWVYFLPFMFLMSDWLNNGHVKEKKGKEVNMLRWRVHFVCVIPTFSVIMTFICILYFKEVNSYIRPLY